MPNGFEILKSSESRRMAAVLLCKLLLMRSDLLDLTFLASCLRAASNPATQASHHSWPLNLLNSSFKVWKQRGWVSRLRAILGCTISGAIPHRSSQDRAKHFWNLLRKRPVARAEDSVKPVWIKPGSFSVLTLTSMISFIKGLARLSFSQMIKVLQIPRNSFLFVFTTVFKKFWKT